jgi:hypothetical protein
MLQIIYKGLWKATQNLLPDKINEKLNTRKGGKEEQEQAYMIRQLRGMKMEDGIPGVNYMCDHIPRGYQTE